jgi:hypothetical protein
MVLRMEDSGDAEAFRVDYHRTVFYGLCGACTKQVPALMEEAPLRGDCVKTTA